MPDHRTLRTPPFAAPGNAPTTNLLGNLDTLEVSLVTAGANGRPFALAKSAPTPAPGAPSMPNAAPGQPVMKYIDPFAPTTPLEEKLLAMAGGDKLTEKGREAVLMAARCLAAGGAELKPEAALPVLQVLIGAQPTAPAEAPPPVAKTAPVAKTDDKPADAPPPPASTTSETTTTTTTKETSTPVPNTPPASSGTPATPAAPAAEDPAKKAPEPPPEAAAAKQDPAAPPAEGDKPAAPTVKACGACKAENDPAAEACKGCGASMKEPAAKADEPPAEEAKKDATASDVHVPTTEEQPTAKAAAEEASPLQGVSKSAFALLPASVRKAAEEAVKKANELERVVKAQKHAEVRKGHVAKAASWKAVVAKADEVGELLHLLHDAAPQLAPRVEALIEKANTAVLKSGLLDEKGAPTGQAEASSDNPLEEVEALAKAHVAKELKEGRKCTIEKARTEVFKSRPDLYSKYDAAHMARSAHAEGA
jgi:hypothetical protein